MQGVTNPAASGPAQLNSAMGRMRWPAPRNGYGLGGATASGATGYAAARVARIVLRREPLGAEVLAWTSVFAGQASAVQGRAELAIALLALPEVAQLKPHTRLARAYDAVMRRYGSNAPLGIAHWVGKQEAEQLTEAELIRHHFVRLHDMGRRDDPCAAPVDARRPFFAVRDQHGLPLLFSVGANGHLYLFRRTPFGNWSQTDLSAALPHFDPECSVIAAIDVKQGRDGAIALALAVPTVKGGSVLQVAAGLAASLDEAGWISAFRSLPRVRGLPEGAMVRRLSLGPVLSSVAPMVLVAAEVQGSVQAWYCHTAEAQGAAPSEALPLPESAHGQETVLGNYRLPGAWTLQRTGAATSLTFASFEEPSAFDIKAAYQGLPQRTNSFLLTAGNEPNVPDLFAAGDGVVVYRGGHALPQHVAHVRNAQLVWHGRDVLAEHVAYSDGAGGLWLVSRTAGCAWGLPRAIAETLVAASLCMDSATGGVHAVGMTPGGALQWQRIGAAGEVAGSEEIAQQAVWQGMGEAEVEAASLVSAA